MRGTKLLAWRIPPVWNNLTDADASVSKGSRVLPNQKYLVKAIDAVLKSIASDIKSGLLETVGVASAFSLDDERCSMVLELPANTDTKLVAKAIDAENVEAWLDRQNKVHIAVSPWYSTKDIDQTALSTIKVLHVLLGMHADDANGQSETLKEKFLRSISEIVKVQNSLKK